MFLLCINIGTWPQSAKQADFFHSLTLERVNWRLCCLTTARWSGSSVVLLLLSVVVVVVVVVVVLSSMLYCTLSANRRLRRRFTVLCHTNTRELSIKTRATSISPDQCCGSGIQCFFTPLDPGWIFSGSRIRPLFWWNFFFTLSSESLWNLNFLILKP
jgi:hypothetical protein